MSALGPDRYHLKRITEVVHLAIIKTRVGKIRSDSLTAFFVVRPKGNIYVTEDLINFLIRYQRSFISWKFYHVRSKSDLDQPPIPPTNSQVLECVSSGYDQIAKKRWWYRVGRSGRNYPLRDRDIALIPSHPQRRTTTVGSRVVPLKFARGTESPHPSKP